jgi:hypothetical protein
MTGRAQWKSPYISRALKPVEPEGWGGGQRQRVGGRVGWGRQGLKGRGYIYEKKGYTLNQLNYTYQQRQGLKERGTAVKGP